MSDEKMKVSELPKEEQKELIAEAYSLGLTGVLTGWKVTTLKNRIVELKAQKKGETTVEENGGEEKSEEIANNEQQGANDEQESQVDEQNGSNDEQNGSNDEQNGEGLNEGEKEENKPETETEQKEPEKEEPKKQQKAKKEPRYDGICHICRSKVIDGVCTGCGFHK